MANCRWYESQSKTRTVLTGYLKPKESQENSNDPPPRWYRYNQQKDQQVGGQYANVSCWLLRHIFQLKILQDVFIHIKLCYTLHER